MTTADNRSLWEAIKNLRAAADAPPVLRRPTFLVNPAHAADPAQRPDLDALERGGADVRVMERIGGPSIPLKEWKP